MVFALSSFSAGVDKETKEETVKLETVYKHSSAYDDFFGTCNIKIYKNRELVYEITLPANTAEACRKMGEATLEAVKAGEL